MPLVKQFLSQRIFQKAQLLQQYNLRLHTCLPANFIEHCQVTDVTEQQITVAAASPAWSHQLRYYIPVLQKNFRQQSIRIVVIPNMSDAIHKPKTAVSRHVSPEAASLLQSSAQSIQDEQLRKSLEKLAGCRPDSEKNKTRS